ncbi:TatD family hydrolase [Sphingobacterium corticis]|uniref:TatD family hydrolase n=1 Tax=Sphingobacterium corticis TaxID=1812823 RepID=A0ABW5NJ35_9SPHI
MNQSHVYFDAHKHILPENRQNEVLAIRNVILSEDAIDGGLCSAGIHPWHIVDDGEEQLIELKKLLIQNDNVLAVGECGLDKVSETDWDLQIRTFTAQLGLAKQFRKPIIVHCVRAYQEVIHCIKAVEISEPIIYHGFQKKEKLADQLLAIPNTYLSLGASILSGKNDALIKNMPINRLFLETDQSPISIIELYSYFSHVRGLEIDMLKAQMWNNYSKVFLK